MLGTDDGTVGIGSKDSRSLVKPSLHVGKQMGGRAGGRACGDSGGISGGRMTGGGKRGKSAAQALSSSISGSSIAQRLLTCLVGNDSVLMLSGLPPTSLRHVLLDQLAARSLQLGELRGMAPLYNRNLDAGVGQT